MRRIRKQAPSEQARWCAICTDEHGPFVQRPLGRNDGMVSICAGCDTVPPRAVPSSDRSYEPSGGALSVREITDAMRAKMGDTEYAKQTRLELQAGLFVPPSPPLADERRVRRRR